MSEIVCTCGAKAKVAGHRDDCPMMTGIPAGEISTARTGIFETGKPYVAEVQELSMPEPILAPVLRARVDDEQIVVVHTVDGGQISGRATALSDDGTVLSIEEGRDLFEIDVTQIVVVQTLRRK